MRIGLVFATTTIKLTLVRSLNQPIIQRYDETIPLTKLQYSKVITYYLPLFAVTVTNAHSPLGSI